ncbi:hypothetical protein HPDFL43_11796 [Hoeflea phototrophica DFL-43]|jgi:hypothetical protein|uniref:Uncharacterized protein n=1 Tax=Hoeflea phototrophica (strain DSM 17068 / NCIMB 14078 / DFL-43) TaxID=411684 RepID=A9DBB9_HOEPD|nr:hypothetical protein [Hoeflea phototrophica]EDQ32481.1 hypothetical protein HPDFL43_11796 [Hoeflea phototrophica DFL-43]
MTHTTHHTPEELDELIIQEKLQVALELQHDAWAESTADGIEPEIIADAAMITAIRETVRAMGEDQAEALIDSLRERILAGEFSPERVLQ